MVNYIHLHMMTTTAFTVNWTLHSLCRLFQLCYLIHHCPILLPHTQRLPHAAWGTYSLPHATRYSSPPEHRYHSLWLRINSYYSSTYSLTVWQI